MGREIIEARKRAIRNETDVDRSIAIYLSSEGMAQFVIDELTPQQLMMHPEIMENASRAGVQKSSMGSTHEADTLYIETPFTEEHIDKLQEDIDDVFIEMIKHKTKILQREYGWDDEHAATIDVRWDTDISHCKEQWGGWQTKEILSKMEMIAKFAGIDIKHLHKLFNKDASENDAFYNDHDLFYVYTIGSSLHIKEYVEEFVRSIMDDGFIDDVASEYGEPGYTKSRHDNVIITANWNGVPRGMYDIIEGNGFDMEWSDEWILDHNEDKIYRSQPDSYGWEPSFFYDDCEIYGIADNEDKYIATMVNNPHKLLSSKVNLEKHGFVDLEKMCRETGWYGKVEDPKDVFDKFKDKYSEMVVQACYISQFSINWRVWGRNTDD